MRVDRRSFLGALAASIASVGAKPVLRPGAADVFENEVLGIRVPKPEGWRYMDKLEWSLVWSDARFESGRMSDRELKDLIRQPLFTMTPEEVDRTGVHANVTLWPDPDIPPEDTLADAHAHSVEVLERIFRDFELLEGPGASALGGREASRLKCLYTAEAHSGDTRRCEVEHYVLRRKSLFIGLNFAHAAEGHPERVLYELGQIRDSIEFTF